MTIALILLLGDIMLRKIMGFTTTQKAVFHHVSIILLVQLVYICKVSVKYLGHNEWWYHAYLVSKLDPSKTINLTSELYFYHLCA